MYVWMYVFTSAYMYASTAFCLLERYYLVAGARMLARRASSRFLLITGVSYMHVCVLDAIYVCCRRVTNTSAPVTRVRILARRS